MPCCSSLRVIQFEIVSKASLDVLVDREKGRSSRQGKSHRYCKKVEVMSLCTDLFAAQARLAAWLLSESMDFHIEFVLDAVPQSYGDMRFLSISMSEQLYLRETPCIGFASFVPANTCCDPVRKAAASTHMQASGEQPLAYSKPPA